MKTLITGAAGFIGSNLTKRCLELGWDVTGVDNLSNGHLEFLPPELIEQDDKFWICDFADEAILNVIRAGKFDVVFHLAAMPRVSYSVEHPLETHETNVTKTLSLIDACRDNVRRFVFASSSSVYGGAKHMPTSEDDHKDPKSPYALQKFQVEQYLRLYADLYDFDSVCPRFFNVFGPNSISGGAYAMAISAWLDAIKRGKPMRSDGDGSQSRDMCYVDNVVSALEKAAQYDGRLDGRPFNVACCESTTNRAILEYLLARYPGSTYVDAPWRAGDVMHTLANIDRSREELYYEPLVSVWEGVERTCDWCDENWDWAKDLTQGV